jgi:hypothetical protein
VQVDLEELHKHLHATHSRSATHNIVDSRSVVPTDSCQLQRHHKAAHVKPVHCRHVRTHTRTLMTNRAHARAHPRTRARRHTRCVCHDHTSSWKAGPADSTSSRT